MRDLKTFGLALVVVLAMSGLAASAASADFTMGASSGTVTATQLAGGVITTTAGNFECANISGTAPYTSATTSSLNFGSLSFSNCECIGRACDIIVNGGCTLELTTTGESHLCPTGGSITLTLTSSPGVSLCTIHFTQHTVNGISFINTAGTPNDLDVTIHATNIAYEVTGGAGKCGTVNTPFTCGVYDGTLTLKAFDTSGNQVNLTKD
jgi:hypothetical protein